MTKFLPGENLVREWRKEAKSTYESVMPDEMRTFEGVWEAQEREERMPGTKEDKGETKRCGKNRRVEKTCHPGKSLGQEMKKLQKAGPTGRKG